jgi:hypothetical protein
LRNLSQKRQNSLSSKENFLSLTDCRIHSNAWLLVYCREGAHCTRAKKKQSLRHFLFSKFIKNKGVKDNSRKINDILSKLRIFFLYKNKENIGWYHMISVPWIRKHAMGFMKTQINTYHGHRLEKSVPELFEHYIHLSSTTYKMCK